MKSAERSRLVLTVGETAELLGLGRTATYEALRRGDLPGLRVGHRWIVPTHALDVWLARVSQTGSE